MVAAFPVRVGTTRSMGRQCYWSRGSLAWATLRYQDAGRASSTVATRTLATDMQSHLLHYRINSYGGGDLPISDAVLPRPVVSQSMLPWRLVPARTSRRGAQAGLRSRRANRRRRGAQRH